MVCVRDGTIMDNCGLKEIMLMRNNKLNYEVTKMSMIIDGIKEALILGVIITSPLVLFFSWVVFTLK